MSTSNEHRKVTKRSPNACSRCRRQKIKCSGQQPCVNCGRRNLMCIFDDRDNKMLVTKGYLSDLQAKLARLEQNPGVASSAVQAGQNIRHDQDREGSRGSPKDREVIEDHASPHDTPASSPRTRQISDDAELTNPMVESSKFMSSSSGRAFYLGTSSNWSFHGQILNLVHQHIRKSPLPGTDLLFDGSAYDLPWDGTRSVSESSTPKIPSIDHAIFLINAVKFYCAQLVHLFDEDEFMANLHAFYATTESSAWEGSLWYIHFLLIIAFGKTCVQHKHHAPRPPGADFFVHALQLLPETNRLCREPIMACEILGCISLYLQALDSRVAAHVTIGQAMRIALAQGMHTAMPVAELGQTLVERCRKIWWTVYILDRQMTSLMGLPQNIQDDDVSCQLPSFSGSVQKTAALEMQIKISRIHADISRTVYGAKGRLRKKFVTSMKIVLDDLTTLAHELRQYFPLHAENRFAGISRMPAHLHLLYYQTIVVVTRPLLFCCVNKFFESPREVEPLISSRKIRHFMRMASEASQTILSILDSLQEHGLLETFLPWDLDALFVSTMVLILTRFVDASLMNEPSDSLDKAYSLLETMVTSGNRIASFRLIELRKLDEMLGDYRLNQHRPPTSPPVHEVRIRTQQQNLELPFPQGYHSTAGLLPQDGPMPPSYGGLSDEGSGFGDDLTAEQILAVAELVDVEGADWLSFATLDNFQMVDAHMQRQ